MCTAITYKTKDHYFGRNLDLESTYHETITITPRFYPFQFCYTGKVTEHHAMIGMATVSDNYPLYYEATNEYGLSMAALNFPGNAKYFPYQDNAENVTPFEFIPWILSQCKTLDDARIHLQKLNLVNTAFSEEYPTSPLHWMISDKTGSITVESTEEGLNIFDNPVGVLTNNPTFTFHLQNLGNYINLSREEPIARFWSDYEIVPYSRGMGAIGLPGDLSSASRFIKAVFTKLHSTSGDSEEESVSQFFHILNAVAQQRGCVKIGDKYEVTVYSSCCNTDKCIYYYTTYENSQMTAIHLFHEDLAASKLRTFHLKKTQHILLEN